VKKTRPAARPLLFLGAANLSRRLFCQAIPMPVMFFACGNSRAGVAPATGSYLAAGPTRQPSRELLKTRQKNMPVMGIAWQKSRHERCSIRE